MSEALKLFEMDYRAEAPPPAGKAAAKREQGQKTLEELVLRALQLQSAAVDAAACVQDNANTLAPSAELSTSDKPAREIAEWLVPRCEPEEGDVEEDFGFLDELVGEQMRLAADRTARSVLRLFSSDHALIRSDKHAGRDEQEQARHGTKCALVEWAKSKRCKHTVYHAVARPPMIVPDAILIGETDCAPEMTGPSRKSAPKTKRSRSLRVIFKMRTDASKPTEAKEWRATAKFLPTSLVRKLRRRCQSVLARRRLSMSAPSRISSSDQAGRRSSVNASAGSDAEPGDAGAKSDADSTSAPPGARTASNEANGKNAKEAGEGAEASGASESSEESKSSEASDIQVSPEKADTRAREQPNDKVSAPNAKGSTAPAARATNDGDSSDEDLPLAQKLVYLASHHRP